MYLPKLAAINRLCWSPVWVIVLSCLLVACADTTPANPPTSTQNHTTPVVQTTPKGQNLPISAIAILPDRTKIELEVARTNEQKAMGLMYRPALPDNRGMLFPFSPDQPVSFWMKNVPVALDMIFLHQGEIKYIAASVPPCTANPCPTYGPNTPIDGVIELRSGRASELKLKVGDRILVKDLPKPKK